MIIFVTPFLGIVLIQIRNNFTVFSFRKIVIWSKHSCTRKAFQSKDLCIRQPIVR